VGIPRAVARYLVERIRSFVDTEVMSGVVLLTATVAALTWANSPWDGAYRDLFGHVLTFDIGIVRIEEDIQHWINDGLMTFFFFVVGLEVKREILRGELAGRDRALLPVIAAAGGMVIPALVYTVVNAGEDGAHGWGIPMATDIAFALGILALLGRGIPSQLRIFVLAMAIADDMGAVLVIVLFYSGNVDIGWLAGACGTLAGIYVLRLVGIRQIVAYVPAAVFVWLAIFESGVSTTLAGVVLALLTPLHDDYGPGAWRANLRTLSKLFHSSERRDAELRARVTEHDGESPLERLEGLVHPYASFLIVPLFALANAGVSLNPDALEKSLTSAVTLGIVLGRLVGKPLGILLFSWVAVRTGLASLPPSIRWAHILGVGIVGGMGFTVALYVNALAFETGSLIDQGKLGIILGTLIAGSLASLILRLAIGESRGAQYADESSAAWSRHVDK
jgi:NhaA family Na+:H+ antiporter